MSEGMKKFIIILLILLGITDVYAQQEAMFTHYMDNTLAVNPAYAGSRDALTVTALDRSQWIGFPGAPETQTLTMHSPIYTDGVNLGLSFISDRIGPVNNTSVFVDYAYRIKITPESKLAFGLKLGFNAYSFNTSDLNPTDPTDISISQIQNTIAPNIGFGVYYSRERFYAGISTPKLFENDYFYSESKNSSSIAIEKRNYYLIVGGLIPISSDVAFKPTSLVKVTQGAPIEGDFTASFVFDTKYSMGLMYRTGDALGALIGFDVTDQLNVGYSFDWSFTNSTEKYNYGTHEIMLRYDFIYNENKKIRSPRYF
jgi:type IX secretion system PorP/SprF family membrane protein